MARKPYDNPYSGEQFNESPVIDPASAYQADPEINFDNIAAGPENREEVGSFAPKDVKDSILEQIRRAKTDAGHAETHAAKARHDAERAAADLAGQTAPSSENCPKCAESERIRLLALADLDNARKRLAREKEDFLKFAGESIIADILPALDNLDLALAYAPENAECKNFVVGVAMTRKLLLDALAKHGLEQIGELGEHFDPAKHEAVEMKPDEAYQSGQVCVLMNKGYRLKDRLLRPARVMVCKNDA